jgi:hypothetical protein
MTISPPSDSLQHRIALVGRDLSRAFNDLLDALPGGPHRPQALARTLGLNVVLTSRLLKMAHQQEPLSVVHLAPGPEPLRRMLRAVERKKLDPAIIDAAHAAVDRLQQLISSEAGDRSALDAIISGWLPDAREKVELLAKQSVFRGISQLLGMACDVAHHAMILHPESSAATPGAPSAHASRADSVWLAVTAGLRRVRPGLPVRFDVHSAASMRTLAGTPINGLDGLLLDQFCSQPAPRLHVAQSPGKAQFTLEGEDVGVRSAVDIAYATYIPGAKELVRNPEEPPRKIASSLGISIPSRTLLFDLLVHDDVYPGQHPELHLYQTLAEGVADPNDRRRDADRIDVVESVQSMGQGIARFRAAETPAYLDMLQHVCAQRDWDGRTLRGYRARIEYPVYSTQVMLTFDLPVAAQSASRPL